MIFIFWHWHSSCHYRVSGSVPQFSPYIRLLMGREGVAPIHSVLDQNVAVGAAVADGVLLPVGEEELAVDLVPGAGDQRHVPSPVDGATLELKSGHGLLTEVSGMLELSNVWVFVQLLFGPHWPMNQLNKNQNIA